jgi:tRNA threonylcarbamoyladenosine biosynthesis protein TsaB
MRLLALDTATDQLGVAVGDAEGLRAHLQALVGRRHLETLAPAVQQALGLAGLGLGDLEAVAVDVGPGLFSGLRVGVAAAKALAQALRVGLVGVSSLDVVAHGLRHADRLVAAVVDARRGQVFAALYRGGAPGLRRLSPYRLCRPEELAEELAGRGEPALCAGDGARRYRQVLEEVAGVAVAGEPAAWPSAASLWALGLKAARDGELVAPAELAPLYLRQPDAAINWEQRRPPGAALAGSGA